MKDKMVFLLSIGVLGLLLNIPALAEMQARFVNKTGIDPLPVFITTPGCATPSFTKLYQSIPQKTTIVPNCGFRFNNAYDLTVVFTDAGVSLKMCPTRCTKNDVNGLTTITIR